MSQCKARYRLVEADGGRGEMYCLRDEGHEGPHTDRHGVWPLDTEYAVEMLDLLGQAKGMLLDFDFSDSPTRRLILIDEIDAALAKNPIRPAHDAQEGRAMVDLLDRGVKIFQQAVPPAILHDAGANNPIVAWLAAAREAIAREQTP